MKFFGELLIFVLLFITNLRVFFVISPKRDPLVALAPFTFILSLLQVVAWGLDLFTVLGVLLSFLVLLSNFHAMFRYSERLYVDHYSGLMRVWAVFTDLLSLGAIVALFIFPPMELNNRKIGVEEERTRYAGDFSGGFDEASTFETSSTLLYEFYPEGRDASVLVNNSKAGFESDVVLFVPDKRGDTEYYKPFLQLLAADGYNVCSADFYTRDCKWFHSLWDFRLFRRAGMVTESILDKAKFDSQREFYTYNILQECRALLKMIKSKYGEDCKIFVVTDGMGDEAVLDFAKENPDDILGYFCLDFIHDYKTPGYGCVNETAPILNVFFDLPRERKFDIPKKMVKKVEEVITF